HARHLQQPRVGLLRSGSVHARTNTALLRAALQRRTGGLQPQGHSPPTHKLVKSRHEPSLKSLLSSDGRFRPAKYTHKRNGLCLRFTTARITVRTGPYSNRG